jgi:hypothetical protein
MKNSTHSQINRTHTYLYKYPLAYMHTHTNEHTFTPILTHMHNPKTHTGVVVNLVRLFAFLCLRLTPDLLVATVAFAASAGSYVRVSARSQVRFYVSILICIRVVVGVRVDPCPCCCWCCCELPLFSRIRTCSGARYSSDGYWDPNWCISTPAEEP